MEQMLGLVVYVLVGMVVMITGYAIIDLVIPVDFPKEIKDGNKAVGWLSAGIYIGLGMIIRSAIISLTVVTEKISLLDGVRDTLIFTGLGLVFFVFGYVLVDLVNRKFNFNEEMRKGNEAVGIMVLGIFLGTALVVSGVIQ